jgi:hypothetical protein
MPGSNQYDAQGRQEPRGKRRTPKKERRNRRRSNGGPKPDSDKFHCPFNIRYPLSFKKGAFYKDSNAVQIQMKCWDTHSIVPVFFVSTAGLEMCFNNSS